MVSVHFLKLLHLIDKRAEFDFRLTNAFSQTLCDQNRATIENGQCIINFTPSLNLTFTLKGYQVCSLDKSMTRNVKENHLKQKVRITAF